MPLVRIDIPIGSTLDRRRAIVDVVYNALTEIAGVPTNDRFMVIAEHESGNLVLDPHFMVDRTADALIIQITFNLGRSVDVKKNLYKAIANGLHGRLGMRTEDVFIGLLVVPKENWSFGRGEAQYID